MLLRSSYNLIKTNRETSTKFPVGSRFVKFNAGNRRVNKDFS